MQTNTMTGAPAAPKETHSGNKRAGLAALFRKELADHINSKRFFIIIALVAVTGVASLYGSLSGIREATKEGGDVFLKLFTTSGNGIPSFVSLMALLGPLVGLTLGFDAINGERSRGTLNRLVAQPIYRDSIINGKFMAGIILISFMVFILGLFVSGVGLLKIGVPPTGEEVVRILVFLLFTIVYISFWLAISILFSILCRHAATSALSVIALWLLFAIFIGLLAGIIANAVYPVTDNSPGQVVLSNAALNQGINRISPSNLYSEAVSTILDPSARTLSAVLTMEQLSGAVAGTLPLGQSLLLVWPDLTGLLAMTMIGFALSYICFMRQEIRS